MDGCLNGSGECFQNSGVPVTRFTGFVWAEAANSCKKVCGFKNIRIRVDLAREDFDFCAVSCRVLLNIPREKNGSLLKVFGSLIHRENFNRSITNKKVGF